MDNLELQMNHLCQQVNCLSEQQLNYLRIQGNYHGLEIGYLRL